MQAEIARIEFELTGSELIALLYESKLVKNYKPIYNRQLRKNKFPYGLYHFQDERGYIHFYIDRTSKKIDLPLTTFTTKKEGDDYINYQVDSLGLCQKLSGTYKTNSSCFHYQIKKCLGACVQQEEPETYNQRAQKLIDSLQFEMENFFIIDSGRHRNEKSIILIENGMYRGFGYVPFYSLKGNKEKWKNFIDYQPEDRDAKTILTYFLRKQKETLNIVPL